MCRGTSFCTELGADPALWSQRSPLWPKDWFADSMDAFVDAYAAAVGGDVVASRDALARTRDRELSTWFDVHAQNTARFRRAFYGSSETPPSVTTLDPIRAVAPFERELFARDGFRCRYCGIRVVPRSVTKRMETLVGKDFFDATSRSNAARHGIKLAFSAALDHVQPHSRGGRTDSNNLVTACWACNYGKSDCTLEELGLDDPRDCEPVVDGWAWP